jgi:hypothetical protein
MARQSGRRMISATAAAKNFGALIERVRTERAEYIVERGGAPAVRISPAGSYRCSVADLVDLLKSRAKPDEPYLKAVEAGIAKLNKPSVPEDRWGR